MEPYQRQVMVMLAAPPVRPTTFPQFRRTRTAKEPTRALRAGPSSRRESGVAAVTGDIRVGLRHQLLPKDTTDDRYGAIKGCALARGLAPASYTTAGERPRRAAPFLSRIYRQYSKL